MLRRSHLDADTADAVLDAHAVNASGKERRRQDPPEDVQELAAFLSALRTAATDVPGRPNADLTEVLASGISTEESAVGGTAEVGDGALLTRPKATARTRRATARLVTLKLATLSLAAKAAVAGAAVVATTAGAGAAGALPDRLQVPFDRVVRGIERSELPLEDVVREAPDGSEEIGSEAPQPPAGEPDGDSRVTGERGTEPGQHSTQEPVRDGGAEPPDASFVPGRPDGPAGPVLPDPPPDPALPDRPVSPPTSDEAQMPSPDEAPTPSPPTPSPEHDAPGVLPHPAPADPEPGPDAADRAPATDPAAPGGEEPPTVDDPDRESPTQGDVPSGDEAADDAGGDGQQTGTSAEVGPSGRGDPPGEDTSAGSTSPSGEIDRPSPTDDTGQRDAGPP